MREAKQGTAGPVVAKARQRAKLGALIAGLWPNEGTKGHSGHAEDDVVTQLFTSNEVAAELQRLNKLITAHRNRAATVGIAPADAQLRTVAAHTLGLSLDQIGHGGLEPGKEYDVSFDMDAIASDTRWKVLAGEVWRGVDDEAGALLAENKTRERRCPGVVIALGKRWEVSNMGRIATTADVPFALTNAGVKRRVVEPDKKGRITLQCAATKAECTSKAKTRKHDIIASAVVAAVWPKEDVLQRALLHLSL
jgi:hypothetical protein